MAAPGLGAFARAPDHDVWITFNGYQRRLYVAGSGRASLPIAAWSGGGQTNKVNQDRRHEVEHRHHTHVPIHDFPFNPFHAASCHEVTVKNHKGQDKKVHASRGGVVPPGDWIAVAKGAAGYRVPNTNFGDFPSWWLCPYHIDRAYATAGRQLATFYIHVAGFLGSDGCIVMSPADLVVLAQHLGHRPYTVLRSTVFEGTELDGHRNVSAMA